MKCRIPFLAWAALAITLSSPASAQFYRQTNLVSDVSGLAQLQDTNLVNLGHGFERDQSVLGLRRGHVSIDDLRRRSSHGHSHRGAHLAGQRPPSRPDRSITESPRTSS